MSADVLLQRLDKVQKSGRGWRALCPACGGRGRKLSVSESDDGRLLLHCFAGCPAGAVVQAVGLSLADLFPEAPEDDKDKPEDRRRRRRAARESQWGAALEMLDFEATIVAIAAADLSAGKALSDEDAVRLALARERIDGARAVLRDSQPWRPSERFVSGEAAA
ncbi:hypothetical protein ACI2IY_05755 [Lysobacter enzymogenes]|uniref:hypothetical protein n=1 Tax=Lysobacter enzymogenes TaxID=69 RepID=UPI00384B2787